MAGQLWATFLKQFWGGLFVLCRGNDIKVETVVHRDALWDCVPVRDGHWKLWDDLLAGGGTQAQAHRHVERPLQPRHTQELPGHRDGLQRGPVQ